MKNLDKVIVIICFFCLIGLVIWLSKEWSYIILALFTDFVTSTLERKPKTDEKTNNEETKEEL